MTSAMEHQADGPRHSTINGNTALRTCILPEQNALEGLLTLSLEPA